MTTLSRKFSSTDPPRTPTRTCNCVYYGGVAGLIIALALFFGGGTYFASATGSCASNCVALGSFMTIMLSQPVALAGVIIGAVCGGVYACATCKRKKSQGTN